MSKYFGKCFGPSTRAPKFSNQMPWLFIIKICGAGRETRNLCHKFNSQGPALRILGLRVASLKSQGPSSRVLGVRVPYPRVTVPRCQGPVSQSPRVPVPGSQGSKVAGHGSQGPGCLCINLFIKSA